MSTEQIRHQANVCTAIQNSCTAKNTQENASLIWAITDKLVGVCIISVIRI